jgi:uncharacterized membrane protein
MKQFLSNPKFKSGYFWVSLIALLFAAAGVDFNTLTSWQLLGDALLSIFNNPVSIVAVITCALGIFNDNSTCGLDKPIIKEIDKNGE